MIDAHFFPRHNPCMSAPARVLELVELFERNAEEYCSANYNEEQTRR